MWQVRLYSEQKTGLCATCRGYERPKENCSECGKLRYVAYRSNNDPCCSTCHKKYFQGKKVCSVCGKLGLVNCYNGGEPICKKCYSAPKDFCIVCKNIKSAHKRVEDGMVCSDCYNTWRKGWDEGWAILYRLRWRVRDAVNSYSESGKIKSADEYGIDYKAIIRHLGKCPGELSDYHIDHIKPLKLFNLNDPEQIKLAFAPENHQWLTIEENLKKGAQFDDNNQNS